VVMRLGVCARVDHKLFFGLTRKYFAEPSRYDEPTSRPLSSAHFFHGKRSISSFVVRLPARRSASFLLSAVRVEGKVTDGYPNGRVF
jgi:hypothetical protein